MTMKEELQICPLWLGGQCPYCDDDWVDAGIWYEEAQRVNQECCKSHLQPSAEEIGAMK